MRAFGALASPHVLPIANVRIEGDRLAYDEPALSPMTFADEATPLSVARVCEVAEGVLRALVAIHAAGLVHHNVQPRAIRFIGTTPCLGDPDVGGEASSAAADIHALGVMMQEALTGRLDPPVWLVDLLARATDPDPARRPTADAMLVALRAALLDPPQGLEQRFLAELRTNPIDRATRMVYTDWLEEHGDPTRASFLRRDEVAGPDDAELRTLAPPDDAAWRAVTSRAPISQCVELAVRCPKRWDALVATAVDDVRHCTTCQQDVYFVTSVDEARRRGALRQCIAIDASLTRHATDQAYRWGGSPEIVGSVAVAPPMLRGNPPGPRRPEPPVKPGLGARIKGWFKR
ncbi:MAG: TIGR02996 domain-containing protein [Proteobacteria bacterium]|nr:TIGR02996 domain-containing protein [Pseudomonadota bacterium]